MDNNVWEEPIFVNPSQLALMMFPAKTKYVLWSRGTGKSFVTGYEIDENVRLMPRGITTIAQATIGQALTKTLPSAFKFLEYLGYKRYDTKTHTGDYVVCRRPPDGWFTPYEHVMNTDYIISFSNGHCLYILSQAQNSRGPNADYNITDEALTISKEQYDQEVAPTNRGNEFIFGRKSSAPVLKHHGSTFLSSMCYTPEQRWLLEPAAYYEEERGVHILDVWNNIVNLQMQLLEAKKQGEVSLFKDIWNEIQRLRHTIMPFVSRDGVLFALGSIFDNIQNVGLSYIMQQYEVMDKFSFMVEILNFVPDKIDNCYYQITDRHRYYAATNDSYIRDFAENNDFSWKELAETDSRMDADCVTSKPIEIVCDWGSNTSFLSVGQEGTFDWNTKKILQGRKVQCTINEFFVKRAELDDTEVNALIDRFAHYYRYHGNKVVYFYRDRYGDAHRASSRKTYNELAIDRLVKHGWKVVPKVHAGIEPPQHDKYLLWSQVMAETDNRFPIWRINATKCKYTLISMNSTQVRQSPTTGKFEKDKRSERNQSIPAEQATHFGDCVDKLMWTKYGALLHKSKFVDARL